jgi:hypothetical protein
MDDTTIKAGSYAGWKQGDRRKYGLVLSVDPSGAVWCLQLHHPYRRTRRTLADTTILAGPAETAETFDAIAVGFARRAR